MIILCNRDDVYLPESLLKLFVGLSDRKEDFRVNSKVRCEELILFAAL